MEIVKTAIPHVSILIPTVFKDERGFFLETLSKQRLNGLGINYEFVQDNLSGSKRRALQGLHCSLCYRIRIGGVHR